MIMNMSQNYLPEKNISTLKNIFRIGVALNLTYLVVETVCGFCCHSMGLLADAVQNLCDVAGMVLVISAYKLSDPVGTNRFNFGFKKGAMLIVALVALVTGVLLTFIIAGSVHQIHFPRYLDGRAISLVAAIGVLVNGVTAGLFLMVYRKRLRMRGAFRHMLADAIVSLVVLVAGIVIFFTRWYILDALVALAVVIVIIFALWELFHNSTSLVLDGVPARVEYEKLVRIFYEQDAVEDVFHLHVWAVAPDTNVLSARVRLRDDNSSETVAAVLRDRLVKEGISYVTLEFETGQQEACQNTDAKE